MSDCNIVVEIGDQVTEVELVTEDVIVQVCGSGGSILNFINLLDTPASYVGTALQGVRVAAGETALEFVSIIAALGVAGGQAIVGGTAAGDDLTLESTSHATKGDVAVVAGSALLFNDMAAPANPSAGQGRVYKKTGSGGLFWKPDAAGAEVDLTATGGTPSWGTITGTLSAQTDLQAALDAKLALAGGTMTGVLAMGANNITGTGAITATSFNGVPLTTGGAATNYLDETGAYSVPPGGTTPALSAVLAVGRVTGGTAGSHTVQFSSADNIELLGDGVSFSLQFSGLATAGGATISVNAQSGGGTGNGGAFIATAGDSGNGATGNGAPMALSSGTSLATNGSGGSALLRAGGGKGTGTDGSVRLDVEGGGAVAGTVRMEFGGTPFLFFGTTSILPGAGTISLGTSVTEYFDDLWLDAVNANGPNLAAYGLNVTGTNAGAYAVGIDPTLLANATATDLMTALDEIDAAISGFVPTSRTLTAGAGLTGGGDLTANRTFDVVANADGSVTVNANDIQVGVLATDGQHGVRGGGTQHAAATASVAGFATAAQITKLDAIEALADVTDAANVTSAGAAILAGQAGGQNLRGGTASGDDLTLESTSDATKGDVIVAAGTALLLNDMSAPGNPSAGQGRLYKKTGDDGIFWKPDAAGPEVDLTAAAGGGEANTASNSGTVSLVLAKSGVDLPFRGLLGINSIGVAINGNDVEIDGTLLALKTIDMIAGAGLTGGGTLAANRTFNVIANGDASIVVNANDLQVGVLATDAQHGVRGGGTQHADVIAGGADGFMTGADKTILDDLQSGGLQKAYENTRTIAVATSPGTVALSNSGDTTDLLSLTRSGTLGGNALEVFMQGTVSGFGINLDMGGTTTGIGMKVAHDATAAGAHGIEVEMGGGATSSGIRVDMGATAAGASGLRVDMDAGISGSGLHVVSAGVTGSGSMFTVANSVATMATFSPGGAVTISANNDDDLQATAAGTGQAVLGTVGTGDVTVTAAGAGGDAIVNSENGTVILKVASAAVMAIATGAVTVTNSYIELDDIGAPGAGGTATGRLYKLTSDDGLWWHPNGGSAVDLTAAGAGEANTASNSGTVSLVLSKSGVNLPFRGLLGINNIGVAINGNDVEISGASLAAGPGSSTDNALARFDGTTGKLLQSSGILVDDSAEMTGITSMVLTHTAAGNDDHAMELIVDAAGNGDVKAIDIVYITGNVSAGEDEEGVLVVVDETASSGGRFVALEVLTTTEGGIEVDAVEAGAGVHPVKQVSGTFADLDTVLVLAVDQTTALSDGGAGNVAVFVNDNDTVTAGMGATYEELEIVLDTGASGPGISPTFEFSTGVGTWAAFSPTDGTNGFKNTGVIAWLLADVPSWATGTGGEYLIRITRTQNTISTNPIADLVRQAPGINYSWDKDGDLIIRGAALSGALTTTSTIDGRDVATDGAKLDGIAAGAQVNVIDSVFTRTGVVAAEASDYDASQVDNDSSVTGAFVDDAFNTLWARDMVAGSGLTGGGDLSANRTFNVIANADASIIANANDIQVGVLATDGQHGVRGGGTQHADVIAAGASGFMTGADKTKLNAIEALADVTDAANVAAAGAVMTSLTLTAGTGLTGGGDLTANRTFNVVAHADASIVANANDIQVGVLATDGQHGVRGGGTQHAAATASVAGFATAAQITKLDAIEALADVTDLANVTSAGAAILAGQAGGQALIGGTASGEDLTLASTSHATKGDVAIVAGSALLLNDMSAPGNPSAGQGRLYKKTGNDGIFWKPDAAGPEVDLTSTVATSEFDDSTFRIQDNADDSKEIAFQASGITTGTVRTITVPDASFTMLAPGGLAGGQSITGGTASGEDLTLISTSHGTKGSVILGAGTSFDASDEDIFGIAAATFNIQTQTTSGATLTIDLSTGNKHIITMASNITTVTVTDPLGAGNFMIEFLQNGTGSFTLTGWPSKVKFPGGTAPTLGDGPNTVRTLGMFFNGTNYRADYSDSTYS